MMKFPVPVILAFLPVCLPVFTPAQAGDIWTRIFRYDSNGDGLVTAEEFGGPARVMRHLDSDGNGSLTREEVAGARRGRPLHGGARGVGDGTLRVGDDAPAVGARRPGSDEVVDLSDPERVTVLVFGSHT